jgi:hypothetical protein
MSRQSHRSRHPRQDPPSIHVVRYGPPEPRDSLDHGGFDPRLTSTVKIATGDARPGPGTRRGYLHALEVLDGLLCLVRDAVRRRERRLDLLKAGDLEIRSSFGLSYHGRAEAEQRAVRMLGLLAADGRPLLPVIGVSRLAACA